MVKKNNAIYDKSFDFALRVIKLYKHLCKQKKEYTLAKQILRSGTSIGANVSEAIEGQSKKDFVSKLSISLKEASETEYWIKLFRESNILSKQSCNSLLSDLYEIKKLLNAIINTTKSKL